MAVDLKNFPLQAVVDVLLSYLQYIFGNPEITPPAYRWNSDTRASKIRLSAPFVIDNSKPMSAPFVIVERNPFSFENRTIDNLRTADPNVFTNQEKTDIMNGSINVICGSGTAGEASNIANFLAIMLHADRHGIISNSKFIRNLGYLDVGPEIPVVKDTEVRRWEVTLRLSASLQIGWLEKEKDPELWEKLAVYNIGDPPWDESDSGETTQGSDLLVDTTKNFGYLNTNDPQLLEQEFNRGWYYIRFTSEGKKQLYTVVEIVNSTTLRLETHDENNDPVAWSAPETATDLEYEILWNDLHIHMELPTPEA